MIAGPAIHPRTNHDGRGLSGSKATVTPLGNYLLEIESEPRQLAGAGVARNEVSRS